MRRLLSYVKGDHSTRLQVVSDLHLEVGQQYASFSIPRCADHLILAGDIGRLIDYKPYLGFLQRHIDQFDRIFLVLGNHEFYGPSYDEGIAAAQSLESEESLHRKVILLHRQQYQLDADIAIIGCTLWSKIDAENAEVIRMKVSDFKHISLWSVAAHNDVHDTEVEWLRKEVHSITSAKTIVVVTHHAPTTENTSSAKDTGSPLASAFATDLLEPGAWPSVKAWTFGHTHFSTDFIRHGVRVFANQRGYVLDGISLSKDQSVFDIKKTIKI